MEEILRPVIVFSIFFLGYFLSTTSAQFFFPPNPSSITNFGRCATPNRERGLCVDLTNCIPLYNLLLSTSLRDADKLFLSRSQCGYQNKSVLICCSDRQLELSALSMQTRTTPTTPKTKATSNLLPQPGECGSFLTNKIYGGTETGIDEFPWMALIEYTKPGGAKGFHCGGSLINNRYVVTASHCVNGKDVPTTWKLTSVRLGEWDTDQSPDCIEDIRGMKDCAPPHIDVTVERATPHPQYIPTSKNQMHDIALLRLSRNIAYSDFIKPICLPVDSHLRSAQFDGIAMDVAGWGKTEVRSASTVKLKATVLAKSLEDCRKVYSPRNIMIESTQLCAGGEEGVDSCRGDSGGPLIGFDNSNKVRSFYFLAGVVSFGPTPCGLANWPGVYTRVSNYVDWIQDTLQP